jgi:hypothetical protein
MEAGDDRACRRGRHPRAEGEAMGRTRTKTTTTTRTPRSAGAFPAPAATRVAAATAKPATARPATAKSATATPRPDVRAVLDRSTAVAFAELRPGARRVAHASVVPFICG